MDEVSVMQAERIEKIDTIARELKCLSANDPALIDHTAAAAKSFTVGERVDHVALNGKRGVVGYAVTEFLCIAVTTEDNLHGALFFADPLYLGRVAAPPTPAERTLLTLVGLTREYLPPDGISKDEFINRVLEVLDNDEMAELVGELEGRK